MELLYACHELKMFNGGEVTPGVWWNTSVMCWG